MSIESYPVPTALQAAVLTGDPVASNLAQAEELESTPLPDIRPINTKVMRPDTRCEVCGNDTKRYCVTGARFRMLCLVCLQTADPERYERLCREHQAKWERVTRETQAPRTLTPRQIANTLEDIGLDCTHLEYVLALAIDGLAKAPTTDECVSGIESIRHVRHVLLGSLSEEQEEELTRMLAERTGKPERPTTRQDWLDATMDDAWKEREEGGAG